MSIVAYSACEVELRPKAKQPSDRVRNERCSIELHHDAYNGYMLRAICADNKKEIFDAPLNNPSSYKIGSSHNVSDEFRCENGTYVLRLKIEGRYAYHAALNDCFTELRLIDTAPVTVETKNSSDILVDIHKLSEAIEQGQTGAAARAAALLISKDVRLATKSLERSLVVLTIRIKIDQLDRQAQNSDALIEMDVYPSTTIRELRALFAHSHRFPSTKQYFFVNGHLAFEEAPMRDLDVRLNALFVLLVLN